MHFSTAHPAPLAAAVLLACSGAALGAPPTFTPVGVVPGAVNSVVEGLSGNGRTAIGVSDGNNNLFAFTWTAQGGLQVLPGIPGAQGLPVARDISHDGSVIVGKHGTGGSQQAVKWTPGFPFAQPLPPPPGSTGGEATCVSANGLVIFARAHAYDGMVRWHAGSVSHIPPVVPGTASMPTAASADGSVAVGNAQNGNNDPVAFRWRQTHGMQLLGGLPGGVESSANDVSADGLIVCGNGKPAVGNGFHATRWTAQTGMIDLGTLPTHVASSRARAMSADGSLLGGYSDGSFSRATIWRSDNVPIDLQVYLEGLGVDLEGWDLYSVTGISANGRTLGGYGAHWLSPTEARIEGFIVTFHCPADLTGSAVPGGPGYGLPDGVLNNDDFFYYLGEFAAGNLAVADLTTGAVPGQPGYGVPDSVLNSDDFFYYLTVFASGC